MPFKSCRQKTYPCGTLYPPPSLGANRVNKGFRFSLCVFEIYIKYAWVIILKDKKGIKMTNPFQKILDESKRKLNKIWYMNTVNFTIDQ